MRLIGPIIISRRSSCRSSRTRTQALRRASRSATLWHPTRRYGGRSHITALKASGQASSRQMPSSARIFMSVLQSLGGLWRRGRRVSISRTCSSLGTAMNSALGMQTALAWIWGVVWQWWSQLVLGAPTATCFPTKGPCVCSSRTSRQIGPSIISWRRPSFAKNPLQKIFTICLCIIWLMISIAAHYAHPFYVRRDGNGLSVNCEITSSVTGSSIYKMTTLFGRGITVSRNGRWSSLRSLSSLLPSTSHLEFTGAAYFV
mmetsp:Transcript_124191/g.277090  ORF Transcript_124191/g.277090 Transcript_124191/m.277090 type:complete len:259 (-) Transcript_124191:127-903(-)